MHKGLQEAKNARVLYIDMNSFFASVEQQYRPDLRDKPLAVVSHSTASGTVLAASYEAKKFGIRTGTKLKDARQLYPGLLVTETTPGLYKATHRQFMQILVTHFGPEAQACSIDEAVLRMPPNWQSSAQAHTLAQAIKADFRVRLGTYIRCSIGIAPNLLLAKLATDLQKPDGLVEITLENTPAVLAKLELTDFPGIAARNAVRLALRGITTPLELYATPAAELRAWFGIWGQYWWWRLHGFEADGNVNFLKTMSHQHVLKRWKGGRKAVAPVVHRMSDRLIHRLRRNQLRCQKVSLWLSLVDAAGIGAEKQFDAPVSNYKYLFQSVEQLLWQLPEPITPIRMVVITFFGLTEENSGLQLDLFGSLGRQESLSQALEVIRRRHGYEAVQLGSVVRLDRKVAKEELGFGRIKDRVLPQVG